MASSSSSANPSQISRFDAPEYEYEGRQRFCFCGLHAPRMVSWTDSNPGRRFFGCPIYDPMNKKRACSFFEWFEGPIFFGRAKDLVIWLLHAKKELQDDLADAKHRNEAMKMRVTDESRNWEERCASLEQQVKSLSSLEQQVRNLNSLEQQVCNLTQVVARTKEEVSKLKHWKKYAQASISCFMLVVFYIALGNVMIAGSGHGLKRLGM